uniref:16 kDa salivary gland protein A n=1 Tax=Ixodes scapularis TaxID=6945 RepID=Q95WZ3_IXOSC|nr:16 kDa salivary gland protein A [Ixodes scapularis]
MVEDGMKNTGILSFIMRGTRLIMATFVLFAICKPIVAGVVIRGTENLAPKCEQKIKHLCENPTHGELTEVTVTARQCQATCTYRPDPTRDTVEVDGIPIKNRHYETVTLPDKMPCGFGARCNKKGECSCNSCNENINHNEPRQT